MKKLISRNRSGRFNSSGRWSNIVSSVVYATWNPADVGTGIALSGGNLTETMSAPSSVRATLGKAAGKWYWEVNADMATGQSMYGIANATANINTWLGGDANGWAYFNATGNYTNNAVFIGTPATWTTGDKIMVALDMDNGKVFFGKNGVWQSSGDPATGVNPAYSGLTGTKYPAVGHNTSPGASTVNFGASAFAYAVPSGFSAGFFI